MPGTFLFTFPTAASPSSTSLTLLLGFGALSAIVLKVGGGGLGNAQCGAVCGLRAISWWSR